MQGNLSRLCNVLSGYLDDIKIAETPAERLGREFPKLMEIADESERLRRGRDILKEVGLPVAEWSAWTDALVN
jgi:PII-like signaling protein